MLIGFPAANHHNFAVSLDGYIRSDAAIDSGGHNAITIKGRVEAAISVITDHGKVAAAVTGDAHKILV
jgi:hypothetical protein